MEFRELAARAGGHAACFDAGPMGRFGSLEHAVDLVKGA